MDNSSTKDPEKMMKEPLLISQPKGGFRTLAFIIATDAFERVASMGLRPNMILYLTREYGMEAARGTNVLFIWSAATNFMPILGAFLADSRVGRYRMIGLGSIVSLMGTILLWSTTIIPQARPTPCVELNDSCKSATTLQLLLLYSSFALISIGAGSIRSSALAFGAEQLREAGSLKCTGTLERFLSWYYVSTSVSMIVAITCVVYIQDALGWKVGFGVPVVLMVFSALSFFLATPFYFKSKAKASLLTNFAQVLVASYRNRGASLMPEASDEVYYCRKGKIHLKPSQNLRFLNKACIIKDPTKDVTPDGKASDPWSLCTVDQVEELKALIKIIPIWSTGMMMSVTISQASFPVLQASTMDRRITSKFEIPAGSFGVFLIITLTAWVALYDRVIAPLTSAIRGKPTRLRLKRKMGIGILFSSASMGAFAAVECVRRAIAINLGLSDSPNSPVPMSAFWLLPYHIFGGLAEAFNAIGQNEFYYTELPKTMSSIASTLFALGLSVASLLASGIMNMVDEFSKRDGKESWVSSNINKGHYDYYYWLLALLCLVNFVCYVACSKAYGPCKADGGSELDDTKGIREED